MTKQPPFELPKAHRWFAVELNNLCWDMLDLPQRNDEQRETMLDAAHGARWHWRQVGGPENEARARCMLACAHAAGGSAELALGYARGCLELVESHREVMADWDAPFAYDCLARAHAAAGQHAEAQSCRQQAAELGRKIADAGDREFFERWHAGGEWHGIAAE